MEFLKLTDGDGKSVLYVNTEMISEMRRRGNTTMLRILGDSNYYIYVTETPEVIIARSKR